MKFCRNSNIIKFITGKKVLSAEDITRLLFESEKVCSKYQKNEDYYYNKHSILNRTFDDPTKINNKLVVGFPKYLCEVRNGYFSSSPLSMDCEDKKYLEDVMGVLNENDFANIFSELDNISSIYGNSFLVMYLDEDGEIRMTAQSPKDWIMVHDNTLLEKPKFAIRYYAYWDTIENVQKYDIELWTDEEIINYEGSPYDLKEIDRRPHYFSQLPVIEFSENSSRTGAFEPVIGLIDAYENILSDSVNMINYFSDCYLVLTNVEADKDDILSMRENRVIVLPENANAQFLMKNLNETFNKNTLSDIREAIFVVACTPLLSDSSFSSNSSGVSISYKLFSLEKSIQVKQNIFEKGFHIMFKLIRNMLNLKNATNYDDKCKIVLTFNRSQPVKDLSSISDSVSKLRGTVSNETLLAQLDFVESIPLELEKIKREREEDLDWQLKTMNLLGQDLDHSIDEESLGGDDEGEE